MAGAINVNHTNAKGRSRTTTIDLGHSKVSLRLSAGLELRYRALDGAHLLLSARKAADHFGPPPGTGRCVCLGSDEGVYAVLTSMLFGRDVIAVDPDPHSSQYLVENLNANSLHSKVSVFTPAAAGHDAPARARPAGNTELRDCSHRGDRQLHINPPIAPKGIAQLYCSSVELAVALLMNPPEFLKGSLPGIDIELRSLREGLPDWKACLAILKTLGPLGYALTDYRPELSVVRLRATIDPDRVKALPSADASANFIATQQRLQELAQDKRRLEARLSELALDRQYSEHRQRAEERSAVVQRTTSHASNTREPGKTSRFLDSVIPRPLSKWARKRLGYPGLRRKEAIEQAEAILERDGRDALKQWIETSRARGDVRTKDANDILRTLILERQP